MYDPVHPLSDPVNPEEKLPNFAVNSFAEFMFRVSDQVGRTELCIHVIFKTCNNHSRWCKWCSLTSVIIPIGLSVLRDKIGPLTHFLFTVIAMDKQYHVRGAQHRIAFVRYSDAVNSLNKYLNVIVLVFGCLSRCCMFPRPCPSGFTAPSCIFMSAYS